MSERGKNAGRVVVIGAGIVGVATAIALQRRGVPVLLLDRGEPGAGMPGGPASYGNAGVLASAAVVPLNEPGLLRRAGRYLADPAFPLFLQWRHLPGMLPWLMRFLLHATEAEVARIARALHPLIADSPAAHAALARGTPAARWLKPSPWGFVYADRRAFRADRAAWRLREAAGYVPEILEGAAVPEREPALAGARDAGLLAVLRDHGHVRDPGAYVADLVAGFTSLGGQFRQARVTGFELARGRVRAVGTDAGPLPCDAAVIAAGVWSRRLTTALGMRVPLIAERGYHLHVEDPPLVPAMPLMLNAGKFVLTPMGGPGRPALRCAGVVELGGTSPRLSRAPLALMRRHLRRVFPALAGAKAREWVGFRPSLPDSLPMIGEIRETRVFAAFGHQHVGLTAGPATGALVADLVTGTPPAIDPAPYRPDRF